MKNRIEFFRNVPVLYILIGSIWVLGTNYLLKLFNFSTEKVIYLETIKDLGFIFITAILLLVLVKKLMNSKQIEEEKEKLTLLIDTMPDFVSFKDGDGKWLQINKFGAQLFELEGVDYRGKTDAEVAKYTDFYHDALVYCIDTDEEAWKEGE